MSDFLLFSPKTYYRLFELYNEAIWPWQIVGLFVGLGLLGLMVRPRPWGGRVAAGLLALCWLWVAWGYHHGRYATINWAAEYFAAAFAFEAALLFAAGGHAGGLALAGPAGGRRWLGCSLLAFALAIQPLIGPLRGRAWAAIELFALTPDPTVLGTLGLLVAAERRYWALWIVPLAWCGIGWATLWTMGSPDAWLLPLLGLAAAVAAGPGRRTRR